MKTEIGNYIKHLENLKDPKSFYIEILKTHFPKIEKIDYDGNNFIIEGPYTEKEIKEFLNEIDTLLKMSKK